VDITSWMLPWTLCWYHLCWYNHSSVLCWLDLLSLVPEFELMLHLIGPYYCSRFLLLATGTGTLVLVWYRWPLCICVVCVYAIKLDSLSLLTELPLCPCCCAILWLYVLLSIYSLPWLLHTVYCLWRLLLAPFYLCRFWAVLVVAWD
jgi:hypothetical protein